MEKAVLFQQDGTIAPAIAWRKCSKCKWNGPAKEIKETKKVNNKLFEVCPNCREL